MSSEQERRKRLEVLHDWLKDQIESGALDYITVEVSPGNAIHLVNNYKSYLSAQNSMHFRVINEARKRYGVSMPTAKDYSDIVVSAFREEITKRFVKPIRL